MPKLATAVEIADPELGVAELSLSNRGALPPFYSVRRTISDLQHLLVRLAEQDPDRDLVISVRPK